MRAAVVGGGILGTLTALRLATAGASVDLVDQRDRLWDGASAAGEGKVHLGHVYGKSSDASVRLMLRAAMSFAPDLDEAVGHPLPWPELVSSPFDYLVPTSSLITPDEFVGHTERIEELAADLDLRHRDYLGAPIERWHATPTGDEGGRWFTTPERAVDIRRLTAVVTDAVTTHPLVRFRGGTRVEEPERRPQGWYLATTRGTLGAYDVVVNCAWEHAAALDRAVGREVGVPNLRLRAFLSGHDVGLPRAVTITLGPYGDYVRFADGRVYASWYPTGILGFCETLHPPPEWDAMQSAPIEDRDLCRSVIDGLGEHVPAVRSIRSVEVHARVVVARGSTDIDDPDSRLHGRDEAGATQVDGWVSARSPKLTTAPMIARLAAEAALS